MQKLQCGAKTKHLLDTFYYHFSTLFHTFLIHFQYSLHIEIEANVFPTINAKY
jgi:hypothetical protein